MSTGRAHEPTSSTEASRAELVGLWYAAVGDIASRLGLRVLLIKGPVTRLQGIRAPGGSVDVDVLVEPSGMGRLMTALAEHGWAETAPPTSAHVLPLHSRALQHPIWPFEIDVHGRFPGFLAEPGLVFEELWRRRTSVDLAHRDLPCPDVVSHAAITALHLLRDGHDAHRAAYEDVVDRLRNRLTDGQRDDLARLCRDTGANDTLAPLLADLRIPPLESAVTYSVEPWRIRQRSTGLKSAGWVTELTSSPWRQRPRRLLHALLLTEAEIRQAQPQAVPGAWGLFRARLRRLRWGLRDLPRAIRIVREERRR
jgi:hypothetical protein